MAKVLLNAKMILGLTPPPEGVDEYFDEKIKGLILRVYSTGRKTWSIRAKRGNTKKRMTIGDAKLIGLADARGQALRFLIESFNEKENSFVRRREFTFEELCHEYIERHAKIKKRTWKEDQRQINKDLLPVFRKRLAHEITRREVVEFLDTIFDQGHKIKVNRTYELIRKIFNFAVEREILDASPCNRIPKMAKENTRSRVLEEDEIRKLQTEIAKLRSPTKELMQFYLMTGQRAQEVKLSEKTHFDFDKCIWTIPAEICKNKKEHRVPITPEMKALLEECSQKSRESKWMFPSPRLYRRDRTIRDEPIRNIQKTIQRLRTETSVSFNGHDFRRTMATWLASQGVARMAISQLLNHTDKSVTAVYDRYDYLKEKREALERWTTYLAIASLQSNHHP